MYLVWNCDLYIYFTNIIDTLSYWHKKKKNELDL